MATSRSWSIFLLEFQEHRWNPQCSPTVFGVNFDCYFNRLRGAREQAPTSCIKVGLRLNQTPEPLLLGAARDLQLEHDRLLDPLLIRAEVHSADLSRMPRNCSLNPLTCSNAASAVSAPVLVWVVLIRGAPAWSNVPPHPSVLHPSQLLSGRSRLALSAICSSLD
jgi:hypothetical protein